MNNKNNTAIIFVFLLFIFGFIIIIIQLFNLQIIQYNFFKSKAQKMHLTTIDQQVGRGNIYDRNGQKIAFNIRTASICACPRKIKDKISVASFLSEKLNMDKKEILNKLKSRRGFVYIKRKVDINIADEIIRKEIKGIFTQYEEKRFYPLKEIGAHIIGFTDIDNKGLEGIELKYDKYLKGKTGRTLVKRDAKGRLITIDKIEIKKAEKGGDVYLTLDSNIQYYAQKELKETVHKYKAKSGSVIILNPKTGEIYALANYPEYDPNIFYKFSNEEIRNRAITDIFEPGSTFKIFTMSAYLKDFPEYKDIKIFCGNGKYFFFNRFVRDHDKYGWLTIPEIIKYSSNIGMVNLALKISQEKLYKEYVNYGFGKKTDIDLEGEVSGVLRNYKEWDNTTLTSIPYGQEVGVTAIQLARAYMAIANGGYLIKPYLVDRIEKNGKIIYQNSTVKSNNKILDEETRKKLLDMLCAVVEKDGTGKKAMIPGYIIAGKTGTAQKHDEKNKGYKKNAYVSSFVGFIPANNPEILVAVVIDEPKSILYSGGDVAAPLFKNLTSIALSYLKIPPQQENLKFANKKEERGIKMPDFYHKTYKEAREFFLKNNLKFQKIGFGNFIIKQEPEPDNIINEGTEVLLYLADLNDKSADKIYMPDVKGLTVRKVLEVLSYYGLKADCIGSGIAVDQDPKPGMIIEKGKKCIINFEMKDDI